jgi:hypothetical protein
MQTATADWTIVSSPHEPLTSSCGLGIHVSSLQHHMCAVANSAHVCCRELATPVSSSQPHAIDIADMDNHRGRTILVSCVTTCSAYSKHTVRSENCRTLEDWGRGMELKAVARLKIGAGASVLAYLMFGRKQNGRIVFAHKGKYTNVCIAPVFQTRVFTYLRCCGESHIKVAKVINIA